LPCLNGGGAAAAVPPGSKLHNSCIHSVASRSWCQITPLTPSCIMSSGILGPLTNYRHPAGHPKLLQLETPLPKSTTLDDIEELLCILLQSKTRAHSVVTYWLARC